MPFQINSFLLWSSCTPGATKQQTIHEYEYTLLFCHFSLALVLTGIVMVYTLKAIFSHQSGCFFLSSNHRFYFQFDNQAVWDSIKPELWTLDSRMDSIIGLEFQ